MVCATVDLNTPAPRRNTVCPRRAKTACPPSAETRLLNTESRTNLPPLACACVPNVLGTDGRGRDMHVLHRMDFEAVQESKFRTSGQKSELAQTCECVRKSEHWITHLDSESWALGTDIGTSSSGHLRSGNGARYRFHAGAIGARQGLRNGRSSLGCGSTPGSQTTTSIHDPAPVARPAT